MEGQLETGATIGMRIQFFRSMKGWNQTRLWREAGIGQSRLSKIENDLTPPYHFEVERIALLLEQPLGHFDTLRGSFALHVVHTNRPSPPKEDTLGHG